MARKKPRPPVAVTTRVAVQPTAGVLVLAGVGPVVTSTATAVLATPTAVALRLTGSTPEVATGTLTASASPTAAALRLTGSRPAVTSTAVAVAARPAAAGLRVVGAVPGVSSGRASSTLPTPRALVLTGARPTVTTVVSSAPSEQPAGTLQAFINAVTTGATGNVPVGIYRESVTVPRTMTLVFAAGTRIYGSSTTGTRVRKGAFTITGSAVTLDFRAGNIRLAEFQLGSFPNDAVISITSGATATRILGTVATAGGVIDGNHGSYAGIVLPGGTANTGNDTLVDSMTFVDTPGPGVRVYGNEDASAAKRVRIANSSFINCSAAAWSNLDPAHPGYLMADGTRLDAGNESGGIKAAKADDIIVESNTFDHCNGPSLWLDGQVHRAKLRFNVIHHGWRAGIMDETSIGTEIYGNKIWECGWELNQLSMWGPGILVSSSQSAYAHDNYVAWCRLGVSFITQARPDNPGASGNVATGNTFGQTSGPTISTFGSFPAPAPVTSPNTTVGAGSGTWTAQGIPATPEAGH